MLVVLYLLEDEVRGHAALLVYAVAGADVRLRAVDVQGEAHVAVGYGNASVGQLAEAIVRRISSGLGAVAVERPLLGADESYGSAHTAVVADEVAVVRVVDVKLNFHNYSF